VRTGRPIAGVIFNPMTDECFTASLGAGANLNSEPIHVSTRAELSGCRMLGPKDMFAHPGWAVPPNTTWPEMTIETRSSIAYRMALVACGAFDATIALSAKRDWDLAAGDLIVQEAGGRVTAHDGTPLRYNEPATVQRSLACAGPALHTRLLEQMMHIKLPRQ
jgi:myo-inositol-1(or 4)-monophosphatase